MLDWLSSNHRGGFAENTMDWVNLVFIGLVIGNLFQELPRSDWLCLFSEF